MSNKKKNPQGLITYLESRIIKITYLESRSRPVAHRKLLRVLPKIMMLEKAQI